MSPAKPQHKRTELFVVLDSSALYTKSLGHCLSKEVVEVIAESRSHSALQVHWCIPRIVIQEYEYRSAEKIRGMIADARELLAVTGDTIDLTEETIKERAMSMVMAELDQLGVRVLDLDWQRVDGPTLSENAVFRRPPFSAGNSEKGFRDALIVEAYVQFTSWPIQELEATSRRGVLVTSDGLMKQASILRTKGDLRHNSPVELPGLRSLLTTLRLELDEALVQRLLPKASRAFFSPASVHALYYTANVHGAILEKYSSAFLGRPPGADYRRTFDSRILEARVVNQTGLNFIWASRIEYTVAAYRNNSSSGSSGDVGLYSGSGTTYMHPPQEGFGSQSGSAVFSSLPTTGSPHVPSQFGGPQSGSPLGIAQEIMVATGTTSFEVIWSSSVSNNEELTSNKLESISYLGTEWS